MKHNEPPCPTPELDKRILAAAARNCQRRHPWRYVAIAFFVTCATAAALHQLSPAVETQRARLTHPSAAPARQAASPWTEDQWKAIDLDLQLYRAQTLAE